MSFRSDLSGEASQLGDYAHSAGLTASRRYQFSAEAAADRLLVQQQADIAAFQALIQATYNAYMQLDLPLGSPCDGWDRCDVEATLLEWIRGRDSLILRELAEDQVLELLLHTPESGS